MSPFYGLHLSLLRKPIIVLVLSCEPMECLANSLAIQLKNNVFQTFVTPLLGSHLLFLVFCRNVRPETESGQRKLCRHHVNLRLQCNKLNRTSQRTET